VSGKAFASDTANNGLSEDSPFATLGTAYEAALDSGTDARIVVLSDLIVEGLITLDGTGAINPNALVTIRGKYSGNKIERSDGMNDSVLQIAGGAKIAFEYIKVNGLIDGNDTSASGNNRAITVTGAGTEVTLGTGVVATGMLGGNGNNPIDGNGILVSDSGKLVMEGGSEVTGCKGNNYGAVCVTSTGSIFEMYDNSRIYGNTSKRGGGVAVKNGAIFTMNVGSGIYDNTSDHGGGVYVYYDAKFTMEGGKIYHNKAESGGGVRLYNWTKGIYASFTMNGGSISKNIATANGGGVNADGSVVTIDGGEIIDNGMNDDKTVATQRGGGVYVFNSSFTMEGNSVISGNTAKMYGGGIYAQYQDLDSKIPAIITMTGGKISGNTITDGGGGGVSVMMAAEFSMTGGEISKNTAIGTFYEDTDHGWGGGVFVAGDSKFTKTDGGIIYGSSAGEKIENTAKQGAALYAGSTIKENSTIDKAYQFPAQE
jgi:hypothetical protein